MKKYVHLWQYLAQFFSEWEMLQTKHSSYSRQLFLLNRAVYEITWKNIAELDRPQIIRCMSIACWTTKATDTHSEHVTRTAFHGNNIWYMIRYMIWYMIYMIWYDMIYDMIYLLTAIGLSPGGRSIVHTYTQTIHRTIQNKQYIQQHYNLSGRERAVPRLG